MDKTIKVDYITKIEGHAKLFIKIDDGKVEKVHLEVVEGARFFEGLLLGKKYDEVPIITSRICGVCPQAHSIASIGAIEKAFGINVDKQVEMLRELLLIGQIIKSHTVHLYFMALPDYYNKKSVLELVNNDKKSLELGIELKNLGNRITDLIGGREIHSISNVAGGFTKVPTKDELLDLKKFLKDNLGKALDGVKLFAGFNVEDISRETEHLYLKNKDDISLFGDTICSDKLCRSIEDYNKIMHEYVETYSSAKHVTIDDKSFFVGALSRINNMKLSKEVLESVDDISFPSSNPYHNNLAQCIEIYELLKRAVDILGRIDLKNTEPVEVVPKKSSSTYAIEAPRGILFHEYEFDDEGYVTRANIITPTTQNLKNMEDDIRSLIPKLLDKDEKTMISEVEKLIRAYDPCISCSTHFLKVVWE